MSRIIREKHDANYTCIANDALRDTRLGWAARGILGYILSRPDDWTVILGELVSASPDGRVRVERALDELTTCGYLDRTISRGAGGRRVVSSTVWERAQRGFPAVVIPLRETDRYEVPKDQSSQSEIDSGEPDVWGLLDAPAEEPPREEVIQGALDIAWAGIGRDREQVRALRAATRPPERGASLRDARGTDDTDPAACAADDADGWAESEAGAR